MTTRSIPDTGQPNGRTKSLRRLLLLLLVGATALGAALLFRALNFYFWPCKFHAITGYYCMTCGATRATFALFQLRFCLSFLLNPLPLLLVCNLLFVMGFEFAGVLRNRHTPFRWTAHCVIVTVLFLLAFCLLRNFGMIPFPV